MNAYQDPAHGSIQLALSHYNYEDAIVLAEALYAEVRNESALFLLASAYYEAGHKVQTYTIFHSKGCSTPRCKFLYATVCWQLGKTTEAETILSGPVHSKEQTKSTEDYLNEYGSAGSFVLKLLANIYIKTERIAKAKEYLLKCLQNNPYNWSAYTKLCQLGEKVDPSNVFLIDNAQPVLRMMKSSSGGFKMPAPLAASVPHLTASPSSSVPQPPKRDHTPTQPQVPAAPPAVPAPIPPASAFAVPSAASTPGPGVRSAAPAPPLQTPCGETPIPTATPIPEYTPSPMVAAVLRGQESEVKGQRSEVMGQGHPMDPEGSYLPLALPRAHQAAAGVLSIAHSPNLAVATPAPSFGFLSGMNPLGGTPQQHEGADGGPVYVTPSADAMGLIMPPPPKKGLAPKKSSHANRKPVYGLPATSDPPMASTLFDNQAVRRSSRIFANQNAGSAVKENAGGKSPRGASRKLKSRLDVTSAQGSAKTPSSRAANAMQRAGSAGLPQPITPKQIESKQRQSAEGLLNLLCAVGKGYYYLSHYSCKNALKSFASLPTQHANTGWILSLIGRAHFELADYKKAIAAYSQMREVAPHYLEGIDKYSTALWHLNMDAEQSFLAQSLVQMDKMVPQTWCVMGNLFSQQKEHEYAIRYLLRAVQLDEEFSSAHALLGFEYMTSDDLDKAMISFRNAIRHDRRHYVAWCGVGKIYFQQERFTLAEAHFRKALSINPRCALLLCHLAQIQLAMLKPEAALATLTKALREDPDNPMCRFNRASALLDLNRLDEAMKELEFLRATVPKESTVYYLTGNVYEKMGQRHLALPYYSWAMDLDPRGTNNYIKESMEKRINQVEEEEIASLDDDMDSEQSRSNDARLASLEMDDSEDL